MARKWIVLIALIITLILVGCLPAENEGAATLALPTLMPSPTPEFNNPYNAELVVRKFMDEWQNQNFAGMYELLSFPSQQAFDFPTFQRFYEQAYAELRFESLSHEIRAQARENYRVMVFNYNVDFQTSIVGDFVDENREMRLVLEESLQDWRVAWSPADIFAEMGNGGQLRLETFTPRRAAIYDRDGMVLADMNGVMVSLSIIRSRIPDMAACVATLAAVLNVSQDDIQDRLNTYDLEQLAEIDLIEPAVYDEWLMPLTRDCDAQFDSQATRRYPEGTLAPHVVGYVGYPDEADIPTLEAAGFRQDSIIGKAGIEQSWDETLRGQPGGRLTIVTPDGELLRILAESGPQPSESVYLTIDADLQRFTQQALQEAYDEKAWSAQSNGASVIAMDVNTGAILAMVSYPTFDVNAFTTFPPMGAEEAQRIVQETQNDVRRPLLNRVTQGEYPTGSTMKIVTALAALDSGVYTLDERYVSTGIWNRDIPRTDWRPGGHGSVTLSEALTHSCNTCFYEAGYRLNETDPWLFSEYAHTLGLGEFTGMTDLPEEQGLIGDPSNKQDYEPTGVDWNFSDAVNIAIGQGGVQVTPLQLARVYAAVANGGTLYRPQLVGQVGLLGEFSYEMTPDPMGYTGISLEVLENVRSGLCAVTTEPYGTATHIFRTSPLQDLVVCGKTGTATSAGEGALPHAWFAGYAPRDNPQIVVLAMVENAGEGSGEAAPIVRRVLEYYFFGRDYPLFG